MAIDISFADYDTVCYNLQHNVMELIKHSVGLSIEINSFNGSIADLQDQIGHTNGSIAITDQHVYELSQLVDNLINLMNVNQEIIYDITDLLKNHEDRIRALEGK